MRALSNMTYFRWSTHGQPNFITDAPSNRFGSDIKSDGRVREPLDVSAQGHRLPQPIPGAWYRALNPNIGPAFYLLYTSRLQNFVLRMVVRFISKFSPTGKIWRRLWLNRLDQTLNVSHLIGAAK